MIIGYAIAVLVDVINAVMSPFSEVTSLPFGADAMLIQGVAWFHAFSLVFWPVAPLLACLVLYIPLKLTLVAMRAVFGSHIPDAS